MVPMAARRSNFCQRCSPTVLITWSRYQARADASLGGSRRSTRSVTGSWRRPESNGRFVASKPLDAPIALVRRGGAEFQTSGLATNETRHVNAALLIADTDFVLLVVIALEYSLAPLKSRPRLPEWLQVPLRHREALESSPGMRPQHQGSPPRRLLRPPFH
jgi:hypothetical protein